MPIFLGGLLGTLTEQAEQINQAMAAGKIPPNDAASVLSALVGQAKLREFDDIERRISALEEMAK